MTDSHPNKPREVHSRRMAIRQVIQRRLASGESIAIRRILKEAGGGSTDTVREELSSLGASDRRIAKALNGNAMQSPTEERMQLRAALDGALQREAALIAENAALEKIVAEVTRSHQHLLERHEETYRSLITSVDTFREAAKSVPMIAAAVQNQKPSTKVEVIKDLVLEGKYRMVVQENAMLSKEVTGLRNQVEQLQSANLAPSRLDGDDDDDVYE